MGIFGDLFQTLKRPVNDEAFEQYEQSEEYAQAQSSGRSRSYDNAPSSRSRSSQPDYDYDQPKRGYSSSEYGTSTFFEEHDNSKRLRIERPNGSKVVPLKTTNHGHKVCVMKPKSFDDSQDISDVILSDCCAIISLSDIDLALAQRIMDFVSGAVYSLNGKLYQIHDCIYFIAPGDVDVSGDYDDILEQTGYNVSLLK